MLKNLSTPTLAAAILVSGLCWQSATAQNGNLSLPTRHVKRLGQSAVAVPPRGPEASFGPEKSAKTQTAPSAATLKRLGSHEASAAPAFTPDQHAARQADYEQMARAAQPKSENKGMTRPAPKKGDQKPAMPQDPQQDVARVLAALPHSISGPDKANAVPFSKPQIDERQMAAPRYAIVDDYSEVFITTVDKPTQVQADRLAAIYLGRTARAGEVRLCIPSEGFVLRLSGTLASDAVIRNKARTRILAERDVVTVTPSVKEGPDTYYLPGHVLANCRSEMTLAAVNKQLKTLGGQVLEEHDQVTMRVFVIQVPKGNDPRVFAEVVRKAGMAPEVVPNVQATLHNADKVPNDPLYSTQQWLEQASDHDIDASRGWDLFDPAIFETWVDVAVMDGNGFDMSHPEWGAFVLYNSYDAANDDNDPSPENADDNHGTPCAGLVGAYSNNGLGVASTAWYYTYVTPVKIGFSIVGGNFSTNSTVISRAATRIVGTQRCVASSHSYSGSGTFYSSTVLSYYQNISNNPRGGKGAVLCASAGNNNLADEANYPAQYSFAITVAASDQSDVRASFSNYGNYVEVTAPGVSTRTVDRQGAAGYDGSDYTYFAGTSAACPIVAGVCGTIARQRSNMGRDSIAYILQSTCDKVTYNYNVAGAYGSKSFEFGYGRINMGNAIGLANDYQNADGGSQGTLSCGSAVNGTTISFANNTNKYYGVSWNESGPDANWVLTVPQRSRYVISLTNLGVDLDLFLLKNNWSSSTIAFGNNSIDMVLEPGNYPLVVDGYNGVSGTYTLTVECFCIPIYTNNDCSSGDFIKSVRINSSTFDSSGCAPSTTAQNYSTHFDYWPIYNNGNNYLQIRSGPSFGQNYLIFIDYDNNGLFGTDEVVYSNQTNTTDLVTTFNAARATFPVNTYRRMRIISSYSDFTSLTTGCPSLAYGETEDHWVYMSPAGWPITFGAANDDWVRGVVRDATGNVYVSLAYRGTISFLGATLTSTSASKRDMAIAKVSDAGVVLWIKSIGNGLFDMEPQGVNIDGSGNPYWAGSFAGGVNFPGVAAIPLTAAGSYDAFTARFNPADGTCLWAKRVGGGGNDYLYGCFVSNSGNVYAGGSYTGTITFPLASSTLTLTNAGGLDAFIVKFDPNGVGIWASHAGSSTDDEVKSIEYNGGDLVACGYMGNNCIFPLVSGTTTLPGVGGSRDGFAGRVNSVGQWVWVKNFGSIFNDEARSICYDPSTGNVFVAAQVADAPVTFNAVAYPGSGNNDIMVVGWNFYTQAPVWARRVGSTTGDSPNSIRWDGDRLVVAGYAGGNVNAGAIGTLGTHGLQDAILLRYNKTTGAITSGLMIGGAGNDQALTLYCNTGNREEYVGGAFSSTVSFYTTTPRVSAGAFDGFLSRHFPPSGARLGENEADLATAAGNLKVYPVPASRELRVLLNDIGQDTPQAFDVRGSRISVPYRLEGNEGILDVSSLKPGIYVLRAGGKTARFVKE